MRTNCLVFVALVAALSVPVAAQDAKTVISTATKAMGADNLSSITFYGSGANFGLGQNNNANGAWPRTNVSDYSRSIDFAQSTSRATGQTFAAPVTGGPAAAAVFQQNITPPTPRGRSSWTSGPRRGDFSKARRPTTRPRKPRRWAGRSTTS